MTKRTLYRIQFYNQEEIYEIYAKSVSECDMFGFLEVGEFVFGENTALVVDTSEERLKMEFNGVKCTYIPMTSIIRIDEVEKLGIAKAFNKASGTNKVTHFPIPNKRQD
jgi:hypothetical protein